MRLDIGNISLSKCDFHVHADWLSRDGGDRDITNTVRKAIHNHIHDIGIVRHIRRQPTFDLTAFCAEVYEVKCGYAPTLNVYTGVEAKVIDFDGMLDIAHTVMAIRGCFALDFLIGSLHTLPDHMTVYDAYESLLDSDCDIIGHPVGFPDSLIPKLVKSGKYYEINYKYGVNEQRVRDIVVQGGKIIHGSDAHEWRQFPIRARLRKKLSNLYNAP